MGKLAVKKRGTAQRTKRPKRVAKCKPQHESKPFPRHKIRVGLVVGKDFDPIPRATQLKSYPARFKCKNNIGPRANGWGGMFHIDVAVGVKMLRMHPDIFKIDFIPGHKLTPARLKQNHVTYNLIYDVVIARYNDGKSKANEVLRAFKNPQCRMWPEFNYYDWVCSKYRYMKQCMEAGIPTIDTIFLYKGFNVEDVLERVRAKQWKNFFVKSAAYTCFGNAMIHGRTEDFIKDPTALEKFAKENKDTKHYMVQPYMLKPNGNVFDEVRNFFIDGQWAYSVYTDGTDDNAVYEQPPGALKNACKKLAERVYMEVLKVSRWHDAPVVPLMVRIDIGVMPDHSRRTGFKIFLNEIESEISTWLARYCPFNLADRMAEAAVKKSRELLTILLEKKMRMPHSQDVKKLLHALDKQLGPI
eukprot:gnl/MRDRNA2_/MRDRNA2_17864_c0_seq1.p1 gnl/MRDRNA2_/MRDRNA2_17864_c0~~gnl/MRDRNA2_/MRDRNA2_17864_c0_seq1.p1  ORF type:complete len:414 (-),score=70.04 gnl/MRDRNA2_/MRDRNA2_17864_c0_seq1:526-1767(-)